MIGDGFNEGLQPPQESVFSVVEAISGPQEVLHVGQNADESTHAEFRVIENTLYGAQPVVTHPDLISNAPLNVLYMDRATNRWFMQSVSDTNLREGAETVSLKVADMPHPDDPSKMLQPIALIHYDQPKQLFRFFPKQTPGKWNGARFAPGLVEMYVETPHSIFNSADQSEPESWDIYEKTEEIKRESKKPVLADIQEVGNRLAKILSGMDENSGKELLKTLQTEASYNQITKQWLARVHMHSKGVDELLGYDANTNEIREIGQEFGFGSRMVFLKNEVIPAGDGAKTIRGSIFLQEYNGDRTGYSQTEILPGVDIIGKPVRGGTGWTMALSSADPDSMKTALNGLVRSLRTRKST